MDFKAVRDALKVRADAALVLAQAIESAFYLAEGLRNLEIFKPSANDYFLRSYWRNVSADRVGLGEGHDRYSRIAFVRIGVPTQIDSDVTLDVGKAIEPAFISSGADDLEFEDPPDLVVVQQEKRGSHFVAVASFPFMFERLRTP